MLSIHGTLCSTQWTCAGRPAILLLLREAERRLERREAEPLKWRCDGELKDEEALFVVMVGAVMGDVFRGQHMVGHGQARPGSTSTPDLGVLFSLA